MDPSTSVAPGTASKEEGEPVQLGWSRDEEGGAADGEGSNSSAVAAEDVGIAGLLAQPGARTATVALMLLWFGGQIGSGW